MKKNIDLSATRHSITIAEGLKMARPLLRWEAEGLLPQVRDMIESLGTLEPERCFKSGVTVRDTLTRLSALRRDCMNTLDPRHGNLDDRTTTPKRTTT